MYKVTHQDIIRFLRQLDVEERNTPALASRLLPVYHAGDEAGWQMDEMALLALTSHMVALVQRLDSREVIEPIEEEHLAQIAPWAQDMAQQMLTPLFSAAGLPVDRSEVGLVALHLAAAAERINAESTAVGY